MSLYVETACEGAGETGESVNYLWAAAWLLRRLSWRG